MKPEANNPLEMRCRDICTRHSFVMRITLTLCGKESTGTATRQICCLIVIVVVVVVVVVVLGSLSCRLPQA